MPVCSNSFILFALLSLRHLRGNTGSKFPSQVWWGFLEGQLLLNVIIVCISFFLSKEFQSEWSTLHIPDVVVNQNFGTFELKFNPLWFSWVPALKPNSNKNVFVQRFTGLFRSTASWPVWLSPHCTDPPYCKFYNNQTSGCEKWGPASWFCCCCCFLGGVETLKFWKHTLMLIFIRSLSIVA